MPYHKINRSNPPAQAATPVNGYVLLARKLNKVSRVRLSDLPSRVTVYASRRNKSALKFDSHENDADAAYAVRCSMSIPIVFTPQLDQGIRAYDGGLQHNYPVRELLAKHPSTPFLSLYLGPEVYEPVRQKLVVFDLISIWTESGDQEAVNEYRDRTIIIDPRPIGTLDFSLSDDEKDFLLSCGQVGALAHLAQGSQKLFEARLYRDELRGRVQENRRLSARREKVNKFLILFIAYISVIVIFFLTR